MTEEFLLLSNMTTRDCDFNQFRSWTGDLWWFNSPEDAPEAEKALTGYRIDSGIAQAKVINPKQVGAHSAISIVYKQTFLSIIKSRECQILSFFIGDIHQFIVHCLIT